MRDRRKRVKTGKIGPLQIVFFLVLLLFSILEAPRLFDSGLTLHALDVGQGDAFLFCLPDGSKVMIDAGSRKSASELADKLRKLGVRKIDILVASHPHEDHIGGMKSVIKSFQIGKVWDSGYNHGSATQKAMLEAVREKGIRFGMPKAGFVEKIGDVTIEVLAPGEPITGSSSDANNNGMVILLTYGEVSFLMMGDIEPRGRSEIERFPRATVLKVSHHGSHNGTDKRLMSESSPEVALLSYGRGNPYGHPHEEVLRILDECGVSVYATEHGDISINTDGKEYTVRQAR